MEPMVRYTSFTGSDIPTDADNARLANAIRDYDFAVKALESFESFLTAECSGEPWVCFVCGGKLVPMDPKDDLAFEDEKAETAPYQCENNAQVLIANGQPLRNICGSNGGYRLTHARATLLEESRKRVVERAAAVRAAAK